jgi:mitotic spindle assembly checkpoint protein MAD1
MSSSRAPKRDSLAAELERDPQLSSAKRQQRKQLFTSTIAHASLERQLATSQSSKIELENKLREKSATVERLERERRWLADREKEQQDEREREQKEYAEEKQRLEATIRGLQTKMTGLQEEHADLSDAHTTLSQSSSSATVSLKSQMASVKAEQTALQAALDESRGLICQHEATITSLRSQLLSQSREEPKPSMDEQEARDMAVVREELHRQASYLRSLEKANVKLTREVTAL